MASRPFSDQAIGSGLAEDATPDGRNEVRWKFRLYVTGQSPKSMTALGNIHRLCEEHLAGNYDIELVDLMLQPERAQQDQILAVPTLVRYLPQPVKRIIGDLSDYERTLRNLDLRSPYRAAERDQIAD